MTRVAIYTRVSDREQGTPGFSFDSQLSACRSYAASQGWVEFGAWTDVQTVLDESRPQYQAMLREMRSWDVVLIWSSDRLGRDAAEWFPLKGLSAADRKVAPATENVDDPFVLGILILAIVERRLQSLLDLDMASILTRAARRRDGHYDASLNQRREERAPEIGRRQRRLETLRDMLADGNITRAEYQTDRARHIEAIGIARRDFRSISSREATMTDGMLGALGQVKDEWHRALMERKRSLLRPLGLTITIGQAEAAVSWAEPLNQILGGGVYAL